MPNSVFANYISPEMILFIKASDRDDAIRQLISHSSHLENPENFYQAVIKREEVITTGIGMGVAIPHAKMAAFKDFFITIGILEKGVDWKSLDSHPVRLIFLIAGPNDKQTEYLKILSTLTLAIKDDHVRKQLFNAVDPLQAYSLLAK